MAIFIGIWIVFSALAQIPTPASKHDAQIHLNQQIKQNCDKIDETLDTVIKPEENNERL